MNPDAINTSYHKMTTQELLDSLNAFFDPYNIEKFDELKVMIQMFAGVGGQSFEVRQPVDEDINHFLGRFDKEVSRLCKEFNKWEAKPLTTLS